jgi:hypothetical protein
LPHPWGGGGEGGALAIGRRHHNLRTKHAPPPPFHPTQDALTPLKEAIPEALSAFLDVDGLVEEVLEDAVTAALNTFVIPGVATAFSALHSLAAAAHAVPDFTSTLAGKITVAAAGAAAGASPTTRPNRALPTLHLEGPPPPPPQPRLAHTPPQPPPPPH